MYSYRFWAMDYVALTSPKAKKKMRLIPPSCGIRASRVNRLFAGRQAAVDLKKPWSFVFDFKDSFEFRQGVLNTKPRPKGAIPVTSFQTWRSWTNSEHFLRKILTLKSDPNP